MVFGLEMSGLQRTERIGPRFLREMLQEFAACDAEENMEKVGEGIPRSVRELLLVSQNQIEPESETASLVRVNPIVPEPGAVKPLYLEFIRAKERGLVGKEVTWKEYQMDGHN